MVLKIWSATDRIFSHFGPIFALLPPKNPKNEKTAFYICVPKI